jgi:hypothetical protein
MALDHFTIMEDWEDFGIISKVGFPPRHKSTNWTEYVVTFRDTTFYFYFLFIILKLRITAVYVYAYERANMK